MINLLIAWLIMTISFLIISNLPLIGVEIESFQKTVVSAAVFGILNAFVRPVLSLLAFPITLLTLGLFVFVINAVIFGLAAALVEGFRLRSGFWSALFGSIALGIINPIVSSFIYRAIQ